jgi:hypothetical protein
VAVDNRLVGGGRLHGAGGLGGPVTRQAWARLAAYAVFVAVVVVMFWINHEQDIARCEARNEATEDSVRIVVDALIFAAAEADPAQAEAFRTDIDRRLTAARVDCT